MIFGIISLCFLWSILLLGALYISTYEKAPIWERVNVFMVGFGIYIAIIYLGVTL